MGKIAERCNVKLEHWSSRQQSRSARLIALNQSRDASQRLGASAQTDVMYIVTFVTLAICKKKKARAFDRDDSFKWSASRPFIYCLFVMPVTLCLDRC